MTDAPKKPAFNPEDSAQREAANAAIRAERAKTFSAQVAETQAPKATAQDVSYGTKGKLRGYFSEMAEGITNLAKTVQDAVMDPAATATAVKNDVNKAIDDAAIKPYGGATSVDRYNVQNPGSKL